MLIQFLDYMKTFWGIEFKLLKLWMKFNQVEVVKA